MKYYLIAGERSGDLHASNLMKALLKQDINADFRFFGGDLMKSVGGSLTLHYKELAFMGFWEVLTNLFTINRYLKLCKKDIEAYKPDALILVDYAGFNLKIAKYAKLNGYKVFYYISPKVWAWNQQRALKIIARVDHMFSILPFEVDFYKKFNWDDVTYVGNPVIEAVKKHSINDRFKSYYNLTEKEKIIAVLPGSRKQEVSKILPVVKKVIEGYPQYHFCVAGVNNLPEDIYNEVRILKNVTLILEDTYNLLAHSDAAIVTSGTATLETALWNVPQVVIYKSSWLSYKIAKMLVKVRFISLVNLIIDDEIVKELIQDECNPTLIADKLDDIILEPTDYSLLRNKLGDKVAATETAEQLSELI